MTEHIHGARENIGRATGAVKHSLKPPQEDCLAHGTEGVGVPTAGVHSVKGPRHHTNLGCCRPEAALQAEYVWARVIVQAHMVAQAKDLVVDHR